MLSPPGTWHYERVAEAFRVEGLAMPKVRLVAYSTFLVSHFLTKGSFVTAYSRSVVRFNSLKELPIELPVRPWPVAILTLKNRTLSPAVDRFVECAHEVTKSFSIRSKSSTKDHKMSLSDPHTNRDCDPERPHAQPRREAVD
jgi:DNA-binding transcriptional LysR family regulator